MRATPNIAGISSTFTTLPKGEYLFTIGEPKTAVRGKDDSKIHGLMYPLTVMEGEHKGKKVFPFFNMVEDYIGYLKRMAIAGYGYEVSDVGEEEFNQNEGSDLDPTFDTDSKFVGSLWSNLKGKAVYGSVSQNIGKGDNEGKVFQQFDSWRPI